jgi:hypothetical protein
VNVPRLRKYFSEELISKARRMGTRTGELKRLAAELGIPHFHGVHPMATVDKPRYGAYIFNTDPAYKPGRHWIGLVYNRVGNVYYFDPLGYPPPEELTSVFGYGMYKQEPTQSDDSNLCGLYVLAWLKQCGNQ